jgi:photosystem II stability/assembly factor-like uncharacterized protein
MLSLDRFIAMVKRNILKTILIVCIFVFSIVKIFSYGSGVEAEAGYTWQESNISGQSFVGVSTSGNGNIIYALLSTSDYTLFRSSDSGLTWDNLNNFYGNNIEHSAIAVSADGSTAVIVTSDGTIHKHTVAGGFVSISNGPLLNPHDLRGVGVSHDGQKIVTVEYNGNIFVSTNSGSSWSEIIIEETRPWINVSMSSDGSTIAAVVEGGAIYISRDGDLDTWYDHLNQIDRSNNGSSIVDMSISSDGQKIVAVEGTGHLFVSVDGGYTWVQRTPGGTSGSWGAVDISNQGNRIAAGGQGYIYTSYDDGVTWTRQDTAGARNWSSIDMSSDGFKVVASAYDMLGESLMLATGSTPSTPSAPTLASYSDSGSSDSDRITSDSTPTFTGTVSNGAKVYIYASSSLVATTTANGSGLYSATSTSLSDGVYNFTVVQEVNGFKSATSSSVQVTIDTQVPALDIVYPEDGSTITSWSGVDIDFDDSASCEYRFADDDFETIDCAEDGSDIPNPQNGEHVLVIKGIDLAGNTSFATSTFTLNQPLETVPESSSSNTSRSGQATAVSAPRLSVGDLVKIFGDIIPPGPIVNTDGSGTAPVVPCSYGHFYNILTAQKCPNAPEWANVFRFTRDLSLGSRDEDVRILQRFLNSNGYLVSVLGAGSINNESTYFGLGTRRALIRFQRDYGIEPSSGYFGIKTRNVINSVFNSMR